jgi:TalC/MipB family fructose-6-phosphate aldolase
MEIWLDTIDYETIADGARAGIISGVTTNPGILSQTKHVRETLTKLLDLQSGPVAVQVTSTDPEGIIEEGRSAFAFSSRIIVKVPINHNGLIAIKKLRDEGVPIMGTGILFSSQALLASNLGVSYIAPYFSHIDNPSGPLSVLKTMIGIVGANGSSTKILVASLKQVEQIVDCASLGVAAATIKPDLYRALMATHPLVEGFSEKFLQSWKQTHGSHSLKTYLESVVEI